MPGVIVKILKTFRLWLLIVLPFCAFCGSALYYGYDLHEAAIEDSDANLNRLIDSGFYLEATHTDGTTPLIWAIERGKVNNVKTLLKRGALVNYNTFKDGETPLSKAAVYKQPEMVRMLIESGADVNLGRSRTPLQAASMSCDVESAKLLIEHGAHINTNQEYPPIILAARENCLDVFTLLVEKGADTDVTDRQGSTVQKLTRDKSEFQNVLSKIVK